MATYKVLQDIEAEDKLLGPLTLRQFIYAGACAIFLYLTYFMFTRGFGFMAVFFFPAALICAFFAWPWSSDQPTEIWALARIRFMVKPRKRIWNQSGVKELVTITAPKKIERVYTNGLSQNEVESRLRALADTIDSRGWAIKNVNVNLYQPSMVPEDAASDRLISIASMPQTIPMIDVQAADDMLDEKNNPRAQQMETKLNESAKARRQKIMEELQDSAQADKAASQSQPAADYWFLNQPSQPAAYVPAGTVTFNTQVVAPGAPVSDLPITAATPTPDEETLLKQLNQRPLVDNYSHLHTIQPLSAQAQQAQTVQQTGNVQAAPQSADPKMTQTSDTDILDLARNDDLNVATIAREAHKRRELPPDEVVISLH